MAQLELLVIFKGEIKYMNNLNPLYEGWFTNLFKGPTAKNLEEAKELYFKIASGYIKCGTFHLFIQSVLKHFQNVVNECDATDRSIGDIIISYNDKINIPLQQQKYDVVISMLFNLNLILFTKFKTSEYCDSYFRHIVSEL